MQSITRFSLLLKILFLVSNINIIYAQHDHTHGHERQLQKLVPSIPYLVYDADSIRGFNESEALGIAVDEGFSQENTQKYLYFE